MTEYEFLDYQASIGSLVVESAVSFITVFSAYVAAVYLVGRKLSLWQSAGLTFACSVFSRSYDPGISKHYSSTKRRG